MARFKPIHKSLILLTVDFEQQVISGSFEYALCHQVEHDLDLSASHVRYKDDVDGACLEKFCQKLHQLFRMGFFQQRR